MDDQQPAADSAPENSAVVAALAALDGLDEISLDQHATVFEDVRTRLRAVLDAD